MKVGVIGAGVWGRNLVRNFLDLGVLAGVADSAEKSRASAKALISSIPVVDGHEELLQIGLDAVAIATPAQTHFQIAKQAMERGLDVFIEKPMTLKVRDAEVLCTLAGEMSRILMVGHLAVFQPAIDFIYQYIGEGKLGNIRTMHQRRSKLGRARSVENVMWSFGVHDVAVLLYLANDQPNDVQVSGHASITANVEDDVYLHMTFPSGMKAHLHNSWLWPRIERELIIVGDLGMLEYDEINQRVLLHEKVIDHRLANVEGGTAVLFEGTGQQPLRLALEHFLECCQTRVGPRADGQGGVEVVSVLEKAERRLRAS